MSASHPPADHQAAHGHTQKPWSSKDSHLDQESGGVHQYGGGSAPNKSSIHETDMSCQTQFVSQRICPIFQVSNVTGESLDLVRTFFNILPHHGHYDAHAPFEFYINDTFSVPFVGTVVSGIVKSGMYFHISKPPVRSVS